MDISSEQVSSRGNETDFSIDFTTGNDFSAHELYVQYDQLIAVEQAEALKKCDIFSPF